MRPIYGSNRSFERLFVLDRTRLKNTLKKQEHKKFKREQ